MSADLREHYELVRRQRDDLMRLGLQKERLSAFVVHDLKNPVNSLDLRAQLLLRDPELPERARESVQRIREEARSLLRLVLNLLDISKAEEGQLSLRASDIGLDALLAEVVAAHDAKARIAEVTLVHSGEVQSIVADADLLRRVIENLLDNAIRHAPNGTEVRVTAARSQSTVEIRVADAGPGIPPEMREKIFERFVQVESGERAVTRTGHGLGLAFCKLAVEAHGGSIHVEDASPGTLFRVRLPG
jgi:signal transduction histidine kinase